jgi:hypothetical protein
MLYSRRSFLKITGGFAASISTGLFAQSNTSSVPYADKAAADKWINQWMQSPGAVTDTLHLGRFADRMYFLTKEIGWTPNPGQQAPEVRVPVGFVTDFASIPRVFWSLLPPDGQYTYPAIIHDYLYWEQPVSRDEADLILRYAMGDFKINAATINTIYAGVRLGGGAAWSDNAALKQSGEKRILKVYPTDATVRWTEWKLKSGVL